MDELGAAPCVLPELDALRGVEQNPYHHLDVHGHTLEVLEASIALERDPGAALGDEALAAPVRALLAEPLADELTRGGGAALRRAAARRRQAARRAPSARTGGSASSATTQQGAELARAVLARLRASERLRSHVAALARHHLRLGFLVHERRSTAARSTATCWPASPSRSTSRCSASPTAWRRAGARPTRRSPRHLELARADAGRGARAARAGPAAAARARRRAGRRAGDRAGPELGELLTRSTRRASRARSPRARRRSRSLRSARPALTHASASSTEKNECARTTRPPRNSATQVSTLSTTWSSRQPTPRSALRPRRSRLPRAAPRGPR